MALYSEVAQQEALGEPNYSELLDWWESWPTARPELLDFWARGAYVRRILHRSRNPRPSVTVAARYVDELEHAIKRLVLLGVEIEFVWTGDIHPPLLAIVPLDIDYEGPGGWGYWAASSDEIISDKRTDKEWTPALGWAQIMPETVTDFLSTECRRLLTNGRLFLAPSELVGLSKNMERGPSKRYEQFTGSKTAFDLTRQIQILEQLEMPYLDGMSTRDTISFCDDHPEELSRFRNHIQDLISDNDDLARNVREVRDSVRELRDSTKFSRLRNTVISIGGAIGVFNFGIATGMAAQAIGAGFVAHTALQWWCEKIITQRQARNNKSWPVWKLAKGKPSSQTDRQKLAPIQAVPSRRPDKDVLWHWLAPPSAGWTIPTAMRTP
jgi:hypothetical protein